MKISTQSNSHDFAMRITGTEYSRDLCDPTQQCEQYSGALYELAEGEEIAIGDV